MKTGSKQRAFLLSKDCRNIWCVMLSSESFLRPSQNPTCFTVLSLLFWLFLSACIKWSTAHLPLCRADWIWICENFSLIFIHIILSNPRPFTNCWKHKPIFYWAVSLVPDVVLSPYWCLAAIINWHFEG